MGCVTYCCIKSILVQWRWPDKQLVLQSAGGGAIRVALDFFCFFFASRQKRKMNRPNCRLFFFFFLIKRNKNQGLRKKKLKIVRRV